MIFPIIQASVAAATAVITASSAINMAQTHLLLRNTRDNEHAQLSPSCRINENEDVVEQLKSMNRGELIELFKSSEAPQFKMQGDWDGILLENGPVMTPISTFITHKLFGMNRLWVGKNFGKPDQNDAVGVNRFLRSTEEEDERNNSSEIGNNHNFSFENVPSTRADGQESLLLRYAPHHSFLSPFWSMKDELRVVKEPKDKKTGKGCVLIGLGSMDWSGGMLNCSPFLLSKSSNDI